MTINAVTGNTAVPQANRDLAELKAAMQTLVSAVKSGDLATAQDVFNTITNSVGGDDKGGAKPFAQFLSKMGGALGSGDVDGAKKSLADFMNDVDSHRHHGRHRGKAAGAQPDTIVPATPNGIVA